MNALIGLIALDGSAGLTALPFAVVPIFANAGAALLPAIIAGLSTLASLLLRPRELGRAIWRRVRAHPLGALLIMLALAGGGFLIFKSATAAQAPTPPRPRSGASGALDLEHIDWQRIALGLIAKHGAAPTEEANAPVTDEGDIIPGQRYFRGGAARRGHDGGATPLGLSLAWEFRPPETMFLSSPLVEGDRVFGAGCMLDVTSSFGSIVALARADGALIWMRETVLEVTSTSDNRERDLKGIFSSPAIALDGTRILIGEGLHPDKGCALICLDAATGETIWTIATPLHIESSPAVEGDLVVVGAGAIEIGAERLPSGDPGFVLAARISDGVELWRHVLIDPESSPVIAGEVVVIGSGFNGHALVALSTASDAELAAAGRGRELWRQPTAHPMTGAVARTGAMVVAGGGNGDFVFADENPAGEVIACDLASGAPIWHRRDLGGAVLGAIALDDQLAVFGMQSGEVAALDLKDGQTVWRVRASRSGGILAAPALGKTCVTVLASDGEIIILDREHGVELERIYANDPRRPGEHRLSIGSPTVHRERIFVGTETGGLRAYQGRERR